MKTVYSVPYLYITIPQKSPNIDSKIIMTQWSIVVVKNAEIAPKNETIRNMIEIRISFFLFFPIMSQALYASESWVQALYISV